MTMSEVPVQDVQADAELVFVSYSHADTEWQRRLTVKVLPRGRRVAGPVVGQLRGRGGPLAAGDLQRPRQGPGRGPSGERRFPRLAILMEEELPTLRASGVRLVPVLLRECLWRRVPALADLQWAHDPAVTARSTSGRTALTRPPAETGLRASSTDRPRPAARRRHPSQGSDDVVAARHAWSRRLGSPRPSWTPSRPSAGFVPRAEMDDSAAVC